MGLDDDLFDGFVDPRMHSCLNVQSGSNVPNTDRHFYDRNVIVAPVTKIDSVPKYSRPRHDGKKRKKAKPPLTNKAHYPRSDSDESQSSNPKVHVRTSRTWSSQRVPIFIYNESNNKYLPRAGKRMYKCKEPPICVPVTSDCCTPTADAKKSMIMQETEEREPSAIKLDPNRQIQGLPNCCTPLAKKLTAINQNIAQERINVEEMALNSYAQLNQSKRPSLEILVPGNTRITMARDLREITPSLHIRAPDQKSSLFRRSEEQKVTYFDKCPALTQSFNQQTDQQTDSLKIISAGRSTQDQETIVDQSTQGGVSNIILPSVQLTREDLETIRNSRNGILSLCPNEYYLRAPKCPNPPEYSFNNCPRDCPSRSSKCCVPRSSLKQTRGSSQSRSSKSRRESTRRARTSFRQGDKYSIAPVESISIRREGSSRLLHKCNTCRRKAGEEYVRYSNDSDDSIQIQENEAIVDKRISSLTSRAQLMNERRCLSTCSNRPSRVRVSIRESESEDSIDSVNEPLEGHSVRTLLRKSSCHSLCRYNTEPEKPSRRSPTSTIKIIDTLQPEESDESIEFIAEPPRPRKKRKSDCGPKCYYSNNARSDRQVRTKSRIKKMESIISVTNTDSMESVIERASSEDIKTERVKSCDRMVCGSKCLRPCSGLQRVTSRKSTSVKRKSSYIPREDTGSDESIAEAETYKQIPNLKQKSDDCDSKCPYNKYNASQKIKSKISSVAANAPCHPECPQPCSNLSRKGQLKPTESADAIDSFKESMISEEIKNDSIHSSVADVPNYESKCSRKCPGRPTTSTSKTFEPVPTIDDNAETVEYIEESNIAEKSPSVPKQHSCLSRCRQETLELLRNLGLAGTTSMETEIEQPITAIEDPQSSRFTKRTKESYRTTMKSKVNPSVGDDMDEPQVSRINTKSSKSYHTIQRTLSRTIPKDESTCPEKCRRQFLEDLQINSQMSSPSRMLNKPSVPNAVLTSTPKLSKSRSRNVEYRDSKVRQNERGRNSTKTIKSRETVENVQVDQSPKKGTRKSSAKKSTKAVKSKSSIRSNEVLDSKRPRARKSTVKSKKTKSIKSAESGGSVKTKEKIRTKTSETTVQKSPTKKPIQSGESEESLSVEIEPSRTNIGEPRNARRSIKSEQSFRSSESSEPTRTSGRRSTKRTSKYNASMRTTKSADPSHTEKTREKTKIVQKTSRQGRISSIPEIERNLSTQPELEIHSLAGLRAVQRRISVLERKLENRGCSSKCLFMREKPMDNMEKTSTTIKTENLVTIVKTEPLVDERSAISKSTSVERFKSALAENDNLGPSLAGDQSQEIASIFMNKDDDPAIDSKQKSFLVQVPSALQPGEVGEGRYSSRIETKESVKITGPKAADELQRQKSYAVTPSDSSMHRFRSNKKSVEQNIYKQGSNGNPMMASQTSSHLTRVVISDEVDQVCFDSESRPSGLQRVSSNKRKTSKEERKRRSAERKRQSAISERASGEEDRSSRVSEIKSFTTAPFTPCSDKCKVCGNVECNGNHNICSCAPAMVGGFGMYDSGPQPTAQYVDSSSPPYSRQYDSGQYSSSQRYSESPQPAYGYSGDASQPYEGTRSSGGGYPGSYGYSDGKSGGTKSTYRCKPTTCTLGQSPLSIGYATTIVSRFPKYTIYEILKSTSKKPANLSQLTENVFVIKHNNIGRNCS